MWCVGMVIYFVRLRAHEISELARLLPDGQREAYEYVCELPMGDEDERVPPRGMDTDKAWAGLQHLLDKAGVPVDIVDCGEPLFDDGWGVVPPCLLTPVDVAEASRLLDGAPFAALAERYDPAELTSAGVYPSIWDEDWALPYLEDCYSRLVALFHAAATEGEPVLTWTA
jgi:hypothetical protein